jgi:hypothetical protein
MHFPKSRAVDNEKIMLYILCYAFPLIFAWNARYEWNWNICSCHNRRYIKRSFYNNVCEGIFCDAVHTRTRQIVQTEYSEWMLRIAAEGRLGHRLTADGLYYNTQDASNLWHKSFYSRLNAQRFVVHTIQWNATLCGVTFRYVLFSHKLIDFSLLKMLLLE